jgi:hypothetical protein
MIDENDICRLWLAVEVAACREDTTAFQMAFWRLEGGLLRLAADLYDKRPARQPWQRERSLSE